jgi:metal-dependent amidase/aminoacylase/carboxypeptidase family protein
MSDHGFIVQKHYLGFETAWRASFQHRSSSHDVLTPVHTLGLNSEMDALPGIGHACGHNLIGIAGVAVALAAKTVLEKHDISGNIVLLGTPGVSSFVWTLCLSYLNLEF